MDVCGCVCMGQDDLEEKFVWKSFSFVLFGAMRGDGGKSIAPSGTKQLNVLDHHPGHTTLIRKQPTGTTKEKKRAITAAGRDVGVINFPN